MIVISTDADYNQFLAKLELIISRTNLRQLALETGFIKRFRYFHLDLFLLASFKHFTSSRTICLEAIYAKYKELCSDRGFHLISRTAFIKQINKAQFEQFAHGLFQLAAEACGKESLSEMVDVFRLIQQQLPQIQNIFVSDGSEIKLVDQAKHHNPEGSCKGTVCCMKKIHGTHSLISQSIVHATITKGTGSEIEQVPVDMLGKSLWLADAGYVNYDKFKAIEERGGYYLVRDKQSINPRVLSIHAFDGDELYCIWNFTRPRQLKELKKYLNLPYSFDMEVEFRNGLKGRVIKSYSPNKSKRNDKEDSFVYFSTNLPKESFDYKQVLAIYKARWSIEINWKNLKQFDCLQAGRLMKGSTIHAAMFLSMFCNLLKLMSAQAMKQKHSMVGKEISPAKVASRAKDVTETAMINTMFPGADASLLDTNAKTLAVVIECCIKAVPSLTNRMLQKSVVAIREALSKPKLSYCMSG